MKEVVLNNYPNKSTYSKVKEVKKLRPRNENNCSKVKEVVPRNESSCSKVKVVVEPRPRNESTYRIQTNQIVESDTIDPNKQIRLVVYT